jgi:hypothetical protein
MPAAVFDTTPHVSLELFGLRPGSFSFTIQTKKMSTATSYGHIGANDRAILDDVGASR